MTSIRNFASRLSQPLLRQFLATHSVELETYDGTATRIASAIDDRLQSRGPGARTRFMFEIDTIDRMATENGQIALSDLILGDEVADLETAHARALWLFLSDQDRFRTAEGILYADERRYGREWDSFVGPVSADLRLGKAALEAFKQSLRVTFDTPNVHIEIIERARAEFSDGDGSEDGTASLRQITIYREGIPNAENVFVNGELAVETRRPVTEAAVTYEPATGIIECVSPQRAARADVVRSFGVAILGCDQEFEPCVGRTYDLSVLRTRQEFDVEQVDRIEDVIVSMLRLHPVDSTSEQITVQKAGKKTPRDIWTVVRDRLGAEALVSDYRIGQAKLVIHYRTPDSNRVRTLPIIITHPHRANIKEQCEIERIISNKYLPRWGLVVDKAGH